MLWIGIQMENIVLQHKYINIIKSIVFVLKYLLYFQLVLNILMDDIMIGKLNIGQEKLQGLMAYSERHYRRLTALMTNSQFLQYTTNCITPYSTT